MVAGMPDDYQRGSDIEWLKHSNDELSRLSQKLGRQAARWRAFAFILLLAGGWVVYRYSLKAPLEELWQLPPELKRQLPGETPKPRPGR